MNFLTATHNVKPGTGLQRSPGQSVVLIGIFGWSCTWHSSGSRLKSGLETWKPVNTFIIQKWPTYSTWGVSFVMHQEELRAHCTIYKVRQWLWRFNPGYLTAVDVRLASTCRSVWPSTDIPSQTITDPPPNQSCWMMFSMASPDTFTSVACAQGEPALICEGNGAQWWTCLFWCSLANAKRAAWCWAVSTFWSEIRTPITCWRSLCRALAVLLICLLAQSRYQSCCWVVAFLQPCPALLM